MTVAATNTSSGPFTANGATTVFPFSFSASSADEVQVLVNGAVVTVGFVITLSADQSANPGGSVTFTGAPSNGTVILIASDPSFQQLISFKDSGPFLQSTLDIALDRIARLTLYLRDKLSRAVVFPLGETVSTLPAKSARAGKFLGFDNTGNFVALPGTSGDPGLRADLAAANGYTLVGGLTKIVTPQQFNGTPDGVTDASAAFAAIEANTSADTPVIISGGTFKIAGNLTINRCLVFADGELAIPNGVTLTLNDGIEAPPQQIFVCTGTGKVVFNWKKTDSGPMEWWGAKPDGTTYCDTAWSAAHTALHRVHGQPGDYLFQHLAKIPGPHMGFIGSGGKYTSTTAQATRLLLDSAAENVLQIGPDAYPGSINAMPQDMEARDFVVARNVAPAIASGGVGVRVQYVLGAHIERVKSQENMKGWEFYGTVNCRVVDPEAVRATAGTGGGTDSWVGFHIDGSASIGAAGGNASLYIIRPSYSCNLLALQTGNSTGLLIDSNFTDIFIDQPEGVSCRDDIAIVGNSSTGVDSGNADCRIRASTSDQFNRYGISISNVGATGVVQIEVPYLGPATAATASIFLNNNLGSVTFLGGEIDHYAAPSAPAISASGCKGLQVIGTAINEVANGTPAITLASVTNSKINPLIKNAAATGQIAIQLSGACYGNSLAPVVMGKASAFTKGVDVTGIAVTFTAALVGATSATLTANWTKATGAWTVLFSDGTTKAVTFTNGATTATWTGAVTATANATYLDDQRNEYNLTGIDSACIASGSGNKLVRQSVQVVATGLSGTNLVSGVVT